MPITVIALSLALVALVPPSPMHRAGDENTVRVGHEEWSGAMIDLPGPHGLRVIKRVDAVLIATADGGGAGEVAIPGGLCEASPEGLRIVREQFRGRTSYAAYACSNTWVVRFDEDGVRLDDEPSDRWRARLRTLTELFALQR